MVITPRTMRGRSQGRGDAFGWSMARTKVALALDGAGGEAGDVKG
jgi:hypothetical protein